MKILRYGAFLGLMAASTAFAGGPDVAPPPIWTAYAGAFVGSYYGAYDYRTFQPEATGVARSSFYNDIQQFGFIGGAQLGILRSLSPRFDLGGEVTGNGMTDQAVISYTIAIAGSSAEAKETLKTNYGVDLAAIFVTHITPDTNFYSKLGGSYANLDVTFSTAPLTGAATVAIPRTTTTKSLFGIVSGIGLTRRLWSNISSFTEFDYYYYPRVNLRTLNGITATTGAVNRSVELNSFAIKTGIAAAIQL